MSGSGPFPLPEIPVHLGLGATAVPQERVRQPLDWYGRYVERNASDGAEGRLVSMYSFDSPWEMREMDPNGEELVLRTEGAITLHQEIDGETTTITLQPGDAVVNPQGAWHTADVDAPCTAVFITPGLGTMHRPR